MSRVFMDALEKHIGQLTRRTTPAEIDTIGTRRTLIDNLLETTTDVQLRRSLGNALKQLDAESKETVPAEVLPHLVELHTLLTGHMAYRKKKTGRRKKGS